jgi:tetratricopeptide (TPR) repeat protein
LDLGPHWPWIAVAALAVIPHLGAVSNPFVFDDWNSIVNNPYMVHPHAIRKIFGAAVWEFISRHQGLANYYRPMMDLFYYLIYRLAGPDAGWFHLACLLLHAAVSVLVAAVVRRLSGRRSVGVLAGLLFAVHPIHSEVTAWISCTPELLSSFFSLLAIFLYLTSAAKARRQAPSSLNRGLLVLALGASVLAAQLSKEIGVVVPLLVVLYEWAVCRRGPLEQLKQRWPEYSSLALATAVYFAARIYVLGGLVPIRWRGALPPAEHVWTLLAVFYRFLALLFWPAHLAFFHHHSPSRSPLEPVVLAGWLSVAACAALALWLYRRRAPELLALPMYVFWLFPVFPLPYIFTGLLVIERAAYLPSVGFCWLAAAGLVRAAERRPGEAGGGGRWPVVVLIALLLLAYSAKSAARMRAWQSEVDLTSEGLAAAPGSFHMRMVHGEALLRADRPAEALAQLRESLRLRPDYADSQNDIGRAYLALGQSELALAHYRRSAELSIKDGRPDSAARAFHNMGLVYRSLGRTPEAIAAYRQALALDPEFQAARNNLGFVLMLEGRTEEAIHELRQVVDQDPTMALAYSNLGLAYAIVGQSDAALRALAQAERLDPNNAETQARIGDVCLAAGKIEPARRRFRRALELQPANARAQRGLATIGAK